MKNEKAGVPTPGHPAVIKQFRRNIIPREPSTGELLHELARLITDLCHEVSGWRDEQDRLRARIATLEAEK